MAVINSVRKTTRVSRERLLNRYRSKALRKIFDKIFYAARQGEESVEINLNNLFFHSFCHDFFEYFKNVIIEDFRKDGFHVETYYTSTKITISWRQRNE